MTKVKHLGKQIFGFSFGEEQSSSDGNREVDTNGDRLTSKALSGAKALLNRSSAGRIDGGITENGVSQIGEFQFEQRHHDRTCIGAPFGASFTSAKENHSP